LIQPICEWPAEFPPFGDVIKARVFPATLNRIQSQLLLAQRWNLRKRRNCKRKLLEKQMERKKRMERHSADGQHPAGGVHRGVEKA